MRVTSKFRIGHSSLNRRAKADKSGVKIKKTKKNLKFTRVNEKIRVSPLLVIDENGQKLGEMANYLALEKARQSGLDLVEIDPSSRPPVCRIMDWGKHKYLQSKKAKENKSKQVKISQKEIRISLNISDHDLDHKAKQARSFFDNGDIVKISMRLRGRENIFAQQSYAVFEKFSQISGLGYQNRPKKSGNIITASVENIIDSSLKDNHAQTKNPQSNHQKN